MEYENKTNEELIDLLEAKDEEINTLQENEQSIDDLVDEIRDYENQQEAYNDALVDRERVSERAFYAGFKAAENKSTALKSWLNHKVEVRL